MNKPNCPFCNAKPHFDDKHLQIVCPMAGEICPVCPAVAGDNEEDCWKRWGILCGRIVYPIVTITVEGGKLSQDTIKSIEQIIKSDLASDPQPVPS